MRCGYNALAMVTTSCLQLRLLEEDDPNSLPPEPHSLEQAWVAWRFRETRRRTGLFIWVCEHSQALNTSILISFCSSWKVALRSPWNIPQSHFRTP